MAEKEEFRTRWGFIAATIGMAVGTGNIWRFPRMAAQYGGGAFLLAYTLALFLWSAPLLMSEMAMGRTTRFAPLGGFRDFMGKKFTWMGGWMTAVCMLIAFYYSVVTGWCLKYFLLSLKGAFKEEVDTSALWNSFLKSPWQVLLFHFISIVICGVIILKGIKGGVEKVMKVMIPSLFVFLFIAAARAVILPGAKEGLIYLFIPEWAKLLHPSTWLQAFTQSAWSTGAAWGLMFTYATYARKKEDIPQNSLIVGFGDQSVALLAGLAVIPTVFALSPTLEEARSIMAGGNTGLTFISLAHLFSKMTGGSIIAPFFFLAMALAALSSLVAMAELGTKTLIDAGVKRKKSAILTVFTCFILGLPSALFPSFLDNQDWVWGLALLLSGFFIILAVWKYGAEKLRKEIINPESELKMGRWWSCIIRYVSPLVFIVLLLWWMYQAIKSYPQTWWMPFKVSNLGTIIFQWSILIAILLIFSGSLSQRIKSNQEEGD